MTITTTIGRPHGYAKYKLENCRCNICGFAVSEYSRKRDAAIAAGIWRQDTGPIRVRLHSLMAAGMGYKTIAKRAGVPISTVSRVLYGRPHRGTPPPATIRHDLAVKLMAVEFDRHPNAAIEATGTARRAQALVALGHTLTAIAEGIGWTVANFTRVVRGAEAPNGCRVEVHTAREVSALYDRWCLVRPDGHIADRARRLTLRRRWFPPLAWDDDEIDDPAALPCVVPAVDDSDPAANELELQHAAAGHAAQLDAVTRVELIRRLTAAGYLTQQIAHLAGTSRQNVGRIRSDNSINAQRGARAGAR